MGIFVGDWPNNDAVKAALGINWAVYKVLRPALNKKWSDLAGKWTLNHGVGIATGEALIVRGGVRDNSDLISIGTAPNLAAKLSELRGAPSTYITSSVYNVLDDQQKKSGEDAMWKKSASQTIGGKKHGVMSSTWWRVPT